MSLPRILERPVLRPGAGLRLEDPFGGPVPEGVRVTVAPADGTQPPQPARRTPSGHYVVHGLAGLHDWEAGFADDPVALARDYRVAVDDPLGRLLPARFGLRLPQNRLARLLQARDGLPPEEVFPIPLFSAPARAVPGDWAELRVSLRLGTPRRRPDEAPPAAWARLALRRGAATLAQGLADARGEALLAFPWPEPPDVAAPRRPTDVSWPLTLHVFHRPLAGSPPDLPALRSQAPRGVIASVVFPADPAEAPVTVPAAELALTLRYGRPLVAVSAGAGALFLQPV